LIDAFAVKGKKTRPTVDHCGLFVLDSVVGGIQRIFLTKTLEKRSQLIDKSGMADSSDLTKNNTNWFPDWVSFLLLTTWPIPLIIILVIWS
jgi:hypothetical protein